MTRVAILWHMHQPFYQDLATGEHILPWVRLHGLKDYWGMVSILREFPGVRATFNLVPSLLVQLEAFARDEARDRHLELGLRDADSLSGDDRAFCLEQFFHAHRPTMIAPYPRYAELLSRRETGLKAFSVDDMRDLQVWHKLAWVDQQYRDSDPRVRALVAKGRGYSEDDKKTLREIELEILRKVVPEYRDARARGQIEIATSPFYHPILPLLCDTDVYLRTHPDSRKPRAPFRHPEDARAQLDRAVALHARLFGAAPVGLWPSEGSVSDAMIPFVEAAGFSWMATDEEILARSLGRGVTRDADGGVLEPEMLYTAYRVGGATPGSRGVSCGFRDHALSDLIGFVYSSWSPEVAAQDFVRRLVQAGRRYRDRAGQDATIFVVLDGENAWEYYADQGRPFLRALYGLLDSHPELTTVTMQEACATPAASLPSIFPGSWINGDFYIWIGHPDDHRAWSQLGEARAALESAVVSDEVRERAYEELLIAEGSDWFWWYGDDHSSEHDPQFDDLFRRHVRNVYGTLGLPVPEELFRSNITTRQVVVSIEAPGAPISPVLDGQVSSYFEWLGAGSFEAEVASGAMHQVAERDPSITHLAFGSDQDALYLRVDTSVPAADLGPRGVSVIVTFLAPAGYRVVLGPGPSDVTLMLRTAAGRWEPTACPGLAAVAGQIVEVRIPRQALAGQTVAFVVALTRGDVELEHHPRHRPIELFLEQRRSAGSWTV
ncbi:MAG: glycoside hydrolase family 57 protein [Vicinamibacterales bacterium]